MRRLLATVALIVGVLAFGGAARAQNYPWCAQYSGNMGGSMNCGFVSFDQCMATVRGMGGFCVVNNRYVPPAGAAPSRSRKRRAH